MTRMSAYLKGFLTDAEYTEYGAAADEYTGPERQVISDAELHERQERCKHWYNPEDRS